MALILNLETATKVCSVSLSQDGFEVVTREIATDHFSHAENLTVFIEEVVHAAKKNLADLDAIAVSEGPGSYTGLRIGASTAKGLCYALDKPLLAINSLKSLAALVDTDKDIICPLFDAMRMEVYTALFDRSLNVIKETEAHIVDAHSFSELLRNHSILFVGPGADKVSGVLKSDNAYFNLSTRVSAKGMMRLAEEKFQAGDFVNVAYFEPFYLKDFIAGEKKTGL